MHQTTTWAQHLLREGFVGAMFISGLFLMAVIVSAAEHFLREKRDREAEREREKMYFKNISGD